MQQLNVWKHVKYKNVVLHMRQYYESWHSHYLIYIQCSGCLLPQLLQKFACATFCLDSQYG